MNSGQTEGSHTGEIVPINFYKNYNIIYHCPHWALHQISLCGEISHQISITGTCGN